MALVVFLHQHHGHARILCLEIQNKYLMPMEIEEISGNGNMLLLIVKFLSPPMTYFVYWFFPDLELDRCPNHKPHHGGLPVSR